MDFDASTGVLRAESGVSLAQLLDVVVPKGWFLPVVPGTKFVTLGGAVANDIHGKNHHRGGSFGCYVRGLTLIRGDGTIHALQSSDASPLFYSTIGGSGLTGLILDVEVQLKRITSAFMEVEYVPFRDLEEFFVYNDALSNTHEYVVAWIDVSPNRSSGRGILIAGNHSTSEGLIACRGHSISAPILPSFVTSSTMFRVLDSLYYHAKARRGHYRRREHYEPFFFPLDRIRYWNRSFGAKGFFQFQCVVPRDSARDALDGVLKAFRNSGRASFVSVLKTFGDRVSGGYLSFPRDGVTLAVDIPNEGEKSLALLKELNHIVNALGGRTYLAKDAVTPSAFFHRAYADGIAKFQTQRDPRMTSDLSLRLEI